MEFQYRAGDDRSRSPPPSTVAAAASANSRSAVAPAQDGHGGIERAGHRVENSAAAPRTSPLPVADPEELQRQAAKEKIKERILREEAEHWALEAEVRRELMEQLFPLLRSGLGRSAGNRAEGSETMAVPAGMTADSPSPIALEFMQVPSKANAPAALPAKRKNPDVAAAAAFTVSAAASSKKQKHDLTCTLCGITATGEKAMQDHLKGKGHRRKQAAALAQPLVPEAEHEHEKQKQQEEEEKENGGGTVTPSSGGCTPAKLTMRTNAGTVYEVLKMDGYLLCEACNARGKDLVTMMCHLEGAKHASKAQKQQQHQRQAVKGVKGHSAPPAAITAAVAGDDPETVVLDVNGAPHAVHRMDGVLLCEPCGVKAPSESVMWSHLAGKKHKNKVKVASVHVGGAGGKEAALVEAKSKEAPAIVAGMGHTTQGNDSAKRQAAGGVNAVAPPLQAPKGDGGACAGAFMAPMEVDEPEDQLGDVAAAVAEEDNASADANSSAMQGTESAESDGAAAVPVQEVKIQVEGTEFTVLRKVNGGGLSCEPCGVHGCDKDGMIEHLYTRAHWDNARLARLAKEDEKEQVAAAPAAAVNNDGDGATPVAEGTGQLVGN